MPKSKKSKAYYALLLNREDRIRTDDPYVPNVVLYQAELFPVYVHHYTPDDFKFKTLLPARFTSLQPDL